MKSNVLWPYSSVENSLNLQGCEESLENVCQSFKVVNKFGMFSGEKSLVLLFTQQHMSTKKKEMHRDANQKISENATSSHKMNYFINLLNLGIVFRIHDLTRVAINCCVNFLA
jgi:hypothetical protein